jgi:hypothetical protein
MGAKGVNTCNWKGPDYSVFSGTSSAKLVWAGVLLPPWVDNGVLFCGLDGAVVVLNSAGSAEDGYSLI